MSKSFSDLDTFLRCAMAYYFRSVRKLQRKRRNVTLEQGTIMHRLLMAGFLAIQRGDYAVLSSAIENEASACLEESADKLFVDEALDYEKLVDDCIYLVLSYFDKEDWSTWEILHVEEEFSIKINGKTLTFTPDLVARDRHGNVWIIDHKSTSSLPKDGLPFANMQSILYFAGVRMHYPEAEGFIFNYIRKKRPTQPKRNKTGIHAVSDLNRIDTTYEVLYAFLRTEAPELLDDPDHRRRLAELRDQPDRFFFTKRVSVNDAALNRMLHEADMTLDNIAHAEKTGNFPRTLIDDRGYKSCSKCEFLSICSAELLDLNTNVVLMDYEPRDPKNRYESEDDDG